MALIYLHLAITVMLFSFCLSHLDTEPECSKFDFQEKLVEKDGSDGTFVGVIESRVSDCKG